MIAFNSFASDIVMKNQKICESAEAVTFMGQGGHCSLIPSMLKVEEKKGYCMGKLMGSIDCAVVYLKNTQIAGMNIVCGNDPQKPILNKTLEAEFLSYNMSAMLNNAKGETLLIGDSATYTSLRSNLANIFLTTNAQGKTTGELSMNLRGSTVPLTEVVCE